jgi:hypothetical protein
VASYACTEYFTSWPLAKWWHLNGSLSEPRGGSSKGLGQSYKSLFPTPQSAVAGGFQQFRRQCVGRHCHAQQNTFQQYSLAFASSCWTQLVTHYLTKASTICCCAPLLIMFQYWPLIIRKALKIIFSLLRFELSLDRRLRMFPFHILTFAVYAT